MAVRFKYAGVPAEKLQVIQDYGQLIDACIAQDKPVYIMPTYTAMLGPAGKDQQDLWIPEFLGIGGSGMELKLCSPVSRRPESVWRSRQCALHGAEAAVAWD